MIYLCDPRPSRRQISMTNLYDIDAVPYLEFVISSRNQESVLYTLLFIMHSRLAFTPPLVHKTKVQQNASIHALRLMSLLSRALHSCIFKNGLDCGCENAMCSILRMGICHLVNVRHQNSTSLLSACEHGSYFQFSLFFFFYSMIVGSRCIACFHGCHEL